MSKKDSVFTFLTEKENIEVALEIADYVERLKKDLHPKFWRTFNARMEFVLKETAYSAKWKYRPKPIRSPLKDWGSCRIEPILTDNGGLPTLGINLGQGSREDNYQLFWGVVWYQIPKDFDHPSLTALKGEMSRRKLAPLGEDWIGWGHYKYRIYDPDFLRRLYREEEIEGLLSEMSNDYFGFFTEVSQLIEDVNQAVRATGK